MAYINGNKPIVTDGLIYALDFGNSRCYTSGSTQATSLAYDRATTSISGSPAFNNDLLDFTSTKFIKRDGSLPALDPNGTFTVMFVGNAKAAGTFLRQDTLNSTINPTSSLFGFGLDSGDFSRSYPGFTSSSLQHVTYRYSQGTVDTFINGIPVTASQANSALTTTAVSNALFLGDITNGFSGSLAQFYVYNRALSADEIYQTYLVSAGRNGLPEIPKPYTQDENVYKYVQTTGITDNDTISAISTFVSGLKSNGLWNKMTAIYPFLTTSTGSQAVNLKDPGVLGLGLTGSFTGSNIGLTPANNTSFIETLGVTTDTLYPTVNTASSHITLLSYDVPKTSSYPAALLGGVGAIGGNITFANGKVIHTFTSGSGSFTPIHPSITAVEVLVVAGGGGGGFYGGGSNYAAGGGGAGGLIYSSSYSVTPLTSYTTVVGEGGAAATTQTSGSNGQNSQFDAIVTLGGGGGGAGGLFGYLNSGSSGGSGGGAGSGPGSSGVIPHIGGSGSIGQGNNGGNVLIYSFGNSGAGGGGAGGAAPTLTTFVGTSPGGPGLVYTISGQPVTYAQGGPGGTGFSINQGPNGTPNTGNGGGGDSQGPLGAGNGGSGVVIVSYPAITGQGPNTGFFITDSSITGSSNSEFSGGITGSGNIGLLTVSRTGSNSFLLRKNNNQTIINTPASGAFNLDLYLGGASLAGATSSLGNSNTSISYASIGAGLTDSEVSTYYNLVSQFQTNLKRQNTLLDNYSGAAAAYSLRRIGPSGYFGPAIRVRRDSDNALRDIGFTSDGQLDTVGLLDFVGVTGSGFVQTWYDQSGNGNNASQATTTAQPFIVTSGSIERSQNKNTIRTFTGGFVQSAALPSFDYFSFYSLVTPITTGGSSQASYVGLGTGGNYKLFFGYGPTQPQTTFFNKGGSNRNTNINMVNDVRKLITADANFDNVLFSLDGVLTNTQNITGTTGGGTNIKIGNGYANETKPSLHQELILYTSSRRDISNNINSNILSAYITGSDPDYQAFITATGITEPTQSAALETLVSDLKSYGLWNKMKAIYPMVTDRNNRFAQSENFDLTWNAVSASVSPNQTTAPNGTTTADLILDIPSVTNEHYIYQTIDGATGIVSGSEYIISAYAKFYNTPYIAFKTNTGAQAWFDVQTGVTGSYTGSNATITNVGNGWYRCALYFTSSGVTGPYNQHIHLARTDNDLTFTGTGTSGSYLWGAQFENGNLLGPYRKTEGSGFAVTGDGSMLDQMKFNLRNPIDSDAAYRLTYSGSWNPGYSGNKPNGAAGTYADTYLNPVTTLSTSSAHFYLTLRTSIIESGTEIGNFGGAAFIVGGFSTQGLLDVPTTTDRVSLSITPTTNNKGNYLVMLNSNSRKVLRNQINEGEGGPATTNFVSSNIVIASGRYANSSKENALTTIGDGLTDYEAKALYWIVQKFQTTLGRQVY